MSEPAPLRRYSYYEGPKSLGVLWTLVRGGATLRCELSTHTLGWELRLKSGANFLRSQVAKTEADVFKVSNDWQDEAKKKGWAAGPSEGGV